VAISKWADVCLARSCLRPQRCCDNPKERDPTGPLQGFSRGKERAACTYPLIWAPAASRAIECKIVSWRESGRTAADLFSACHARTVWYNARSSSLSCFPGMPPRGIVPAAVCHGITWRRRASGTLSYLVRLPSDCCYPRNRRQASVHKSRWFPVRIVLPV
jgi:hypothetical protein